MSIFVTEQNCFLILTESFVLQETQILVRYRHYPERLPHHESYHPNHHRQNFHNHHLLQLFSHLHLCLHWNNFYN